MDKIELLNQKMGEDKRKVGFWSGIFNLLLITLAACVSNIPKVLVVGIIIILCALLTYILILYFRIRKFQKETRDGSGLLGENTKCKNVL